MPSIEWTQNPEEHPFRLEGNSNAWTDQGSPLPYVLTFCQESRNWSAAFEGSLVCRGTLQECMAACEAADHDGIFEAHPDFNALARESAE